MISAFDLYVMFESILLCVQAKDYYELLKFHNKIKYFVPKNSSGNQ